MKNLNHTRAVLALVLLLSALFFACGNNLLALPPTLVSVTLVGAPNAAAGYNSTTISFETSSAVTALVEYGTSSDSLVFATPRTTEESRNHSINITGLESATTYYYKIRVFISNSRSFSYETSSFATSTVALVGNVTETPSYNDASIDFTTNTEVTVLIEYGTAPGSLLFATPQTTTASTSHSITIPDLQPTTTYYYRIRTFLASSAASNFAVDSFTTLINPATPGFQSGPTATPALSSIQINWTSPVAVTYLVEWGTSSGSYPNSTPLATPAATNCTVTISGLTQGQTIYYRVRMFWTGADYVSGEFTATTNAESPPDYVRARGIWLIGGLSGATIGTTVTAIDLYDPETNTWYPDVAAGASGTYIPVSFAGYAAYNGRLYVIGGFDSTGACRNLVQIYNTATNSWSTGNVITTARANVTGALYNGKIYIMGGTTASASTAFAAQNTTYVYDIAGNSWATLLAPGAAANRSVLPYNGTIFHFGGKSAATTYLSTHEGYYVATNQATSGTTEVALSAVRAGISELVYKPQGKTPMFIVIGGVSASTATTGNFINQGTTGATLVNTVQYLCFPFAAPAAWTNITAGDEYPFSTAFGAAVASQIGGTWYLYNFGGTQALGASAAGQASLYRVTAPPEPPATWDVVSWESMTVMPRARWGHGAVTFANQE